MSALLAIEQLSVDYHRSGALVQAVKDVSLQVDAGEVVGLVGESGSGKSTVALAVLRLIRPQEGRIVEGKILFEGHDVLRMTNETVRRLRGQKIAMIFQDPFTSLNPVLRIHDQMAEVLAAHHLTRSSSDPLREILDHVQLDAARVLNSYPHQLSGGQRQRVLIATALLAKPTLILADEPTTALDVLVQKEILDLLASLQNEQGFGMILISHNLAVVGRYAHRIAVMKEGAIVETGITHDVLHRPTHPYSQELIKAIPCR